MNDAGANKEGPSIAELDGFAVETRPGAAVPAACCRAGAAGP